MEMKWIDAKLTVPTEFIDKYQHFQDSARVLVVAEVEIWRGGYVTNIYAGFYREYYASEDNVMSWEVEGLGNDDTVMEVKYWMSIPAPPQEEEDDC